MDILFVGRYRIRPEFRNDMWNYLNEEYNLLKTDSFRFLYNKWGLLGTRYLNWVNFCINTNTKVNIDEKKKARVCTPRFDRNNGILKIFVICAEKSGIDDFMYDFLGIMNEIAEEKMDINETMDEMIEDYHKQNPKYKIFINGKLESC